MSINNPIPRAIISEVMIEHLNHAAQRFGTGLTDNAIRKHLTNRWSTRQELNNYIRDLRVTMRDKLNDGID